MCKSIPIVQYKWETWRTHEESKLDYKYYLTSDPEFIYREDWAVHNYNIFIEYHTINQKNILKYIPNYMNKCTNIQCNLMKNNNIAHCCMRCKKSNGLRHGKCCTKTIISSR